MTEKARSSVTKTGYRAVLLDLDGTTLDAQAHLTEHTRRVIAAVRARGIKVFLATGRSAVAAVPYHRELELDTHLFCYDGFVVLEPEQYAWVQQRCIDDHLTRSLIHHAQEVTEFFYVYKDDIKFTHPFSTEAHQRFSSLLKNVQVVPVADMPRSAVNKISYFFAPEAFARFQEQLARYNGSLTVREFPLFTMPEFGPTELIPLDFFAAGGGKGLAVTFLGEQYGIPPSEIVAVGDYLNDVSMLQAAGLGVAVENASPEVKEVADLVIGRHDEEGVARFLAELFLDERDPVREG